MQSDLTAHLDGTRSASEELGDCDGTKSETEELSEDSGDVTAPAEGVDSDDCLDNPNVCENDGEWQDWRCQQAVEHTPGAPPLCNACKHFFGEYKPLVIVKRFETPNGMIEKTFWFRFLATLQALQLSARSGCAFCKLISAVIRGESPGFEPAETVKIKFRVFTHQHQSPELLFTYMGRIPPQGTVTRSRIRYLTFILWSTYKTTQSVLFVQADTPPQAILKTTCRSTKSCRILTPPITWIS